MKKKIAQFSMRWLYYTKAIELNIMYPFKITVKENLMNWQIVHNIVLSDKRQGNKFYVDNAYHNTKCICKCVYMPILSCRTKCHE